MNTIVDIRNNETVEDLLKMLSNYPLRRFDTWADAPEEWAFIDNNHIAVYQDFPTKEGRCYLASDTQEYKGLTVFSGNFFNYSYSFSVATDDNDLISKLTNAIQENMKRPDYLAQDKPTSIMGEHYILFKDGTKLFFDNGKYLPK